MMAVSIDDLWVASQWLDVNDGAEDAPACKRVADWIRQEITKRERLATERAVVKRTGAPLAVVRLAMKERT